MYLIALILLFVDQLSKYVIRQNMSLAESIPVINRVFHITYVENKGIAFGLFPQGHFLFIVISLIIILAIVFFARKKIIKSLKEKVCLGLVLGGALGNLVDRLRFGFVIDFLDFRIWPVFNLADSGVCIGGILMVFFLLKKRTRKEKTVAERDERACRA
ncbi:MAG: signal peptidase II [Elusimicrobiota bacterium]|nr:signal peptidase II [Elusimicrobiota bacterium]